MDKVEFYRDAQGEFRWTRKAEGNYEIVGAASEGYSQYRWAYENAYRLFGDTVEYEKWPIEETGDGPSVEVDDGATDPS